MSIWGQTTSLLLRPAWAQWREGLREARRPSLRWALVLTLCVAASLLDGLGTYAVLSDASGKFSEVNPLAAFVMGVVGLELYLLFANVLTLVLSGPILLAGRGAGFQQVLFAGVLTACVLKVLAGSWNFYLLYAY